jgi:hypothetical protein
LAGLRHGVVAWAKETISDVDDAEMLLERQRRKHVEALARFETEHDARKGDQQE